MAKVEQEHLSAEIKFKKIPPWLVPRLSTKLSSLKVGDVVSSSYSRGPHKSHRVVISSAPALNEREGAVLELVSLGGKSYNEQTEAIYDSALVGVVDAADFIVSESRSPTHRSHVIFKVPGGVLYIAGCRKFTEFAAASRHWRKDIFFKGGRWKIDTARRLFAEARKRGWIKPKLPKPKKVPAPKKVTRPTLKKARRAR